MHSQDGGLHDGHVICLNADKTGAADRLSDFLSTIAWWLKGQSSSQSTVSWSSTDHAAASLSGSAREMADYIAHYLSAAFNGPYVATCYEPKLGRLHPARPRPEPLLHMAWRPLNERPMQPAFDLNIGADDLCFSGFVTPTTQEERLALKTTLALKEDAIQERMWEQSLRFVPEAGDRVWSLWNGERATWLPSGLSRAPRRFGVMIEGGPLTMPIPPGKVAYHVSDNVRRAKQVLDLL